MNREYTELIRSALVYSLLREDDETEELLATAESPSADLYKKLDDDIKTMRERHHTSFGFKKVIAIIAAALLIFGLAGISVSAIRERIKGFIIEHFDGYAHLTTDETETQDASARNVSVNYIPEGFEQIKNEYGPFDIFVCLEWKKAEKNIRLYCDIKTSQGFTNLNTENSAFREEAIGDVSVYITEKYGHTTLTWTDDIMVYTLDSTGIEWDEIVRIFEGIKYEEAEQT